MQARPMSSCGVCLSVYVCLTRSCILSKRINIIFEIFSPSGSQAILIFLYQTAYQYFDGNPPNGGVECRWGRQKSRLCANIWLQCLLLTLSQARCCQRGRRWTTATVPQVEYDTAAVLIAQEDDEMFMTRSLNVTPKTTEQRI